MITAHYHQCAVCRDPIECRCTDTTEGLPRLCATHAKEQRKRGRMEDSYSPYRRPLFKGHRI